MIAPKIWEIFNMVWFSLGLLLLLGYSFKMTFLTITHYGALAGAVVFLVVNLMIIYAITYATPLRDYGGRSN